MMEHVIRKALSRTHEFCSFIGPTSMFGYIPLQTVESAFVSILTKPASPSDDNHDHADMYDPLELFIRQVISYIKNKYSISTPNNEMIEYASWCIIHRFRSIEEIITTNYSQSPPSSLQQFLTSLTKIENSTMHTFLDNLVHAFIIKSAYFQLLGIVTPEAIFSNR